MKTCNKGLLVGLIATALLVGCGKKEEAPAAQPQAATTATLAPAHKNEIIVATEAAFEPFEWLNDKKELVGFDIDLVKAIAANQGLTVKFANMPFESTFTAVREGRADMVAAAVTITDDRRQTLDFSEPYFNGGLAIATATDSVKSLDSLKKVKVGVQEATTAESTMTKLMGGTSPNIFGFKDTDKAFDALLRGDIKAVLADNWVVGKFAQGHADKGVKMVSDPAIPVEPSGFVFKQGNTELAARINAGLKAIKENGSYARIHEQYFGTPPKQ